MPTKDAKLQRYVEDTANLLRLGRWDFRIVLVDTEIIMDKDADILIDDGQHSAKIRITERFFDYALSRQKYIIVHELLHGLLRNLMICADALSPQVTNAAWSVFFSLFSQQEELLIDELAKIIAPEIPDPTEWEAE